MKRYLVLALAGLLTLSGCARQESQEEHYDKIPMVMVEGVLYYDSGLDNQEPRCGVMDGEITSAVEGWETPTEDDQSNFGTGYGYQYGAEGTIEVNLDGTWRVFEQGSGEGKIHFGDRRFDKGYLSEETLEWLTWYNALSPEEQLTVNSVPAELAPTGEDEAAETDPWGVTLTAENVTAGSLTLVCTQSAGSPTGGLLTGSHYWLEQKTEAGWEPLPTRQKNVAWTTEGWPIPQDETLEWSVHWKWLYGTLPAGEYRIGKKVLDHRSPGDYDERNYYAEFVIE